jgi:hypothetical protein
MISEKPTMSEAAPSNMLLNAETQNIEEFALSNDTKNKNETQKHDKRSNKKEMKTEHSPFVQSDISEKTNYKNETTVNNISPEIASVKKLPQDESTNALTDIFMFLNSLSLLNVIIMAICAVIVLYLIILIIVALICLGRKKDKNTAGRYNLNIAQQYQGGKRGKDKSEQSDADLEEVRHSFSSGNSSSSPRSFDTVTTTSDRENLGPRKLNFFEEDQDKSVDLKQF